MTEHTAGLLYRGQPGALNESISDVFGVLVKQFALGQTAAEADWLVGAELLLPGVQGRALRDMQHPGTAFDDPNLGTDPQPAHMDDYVVTDSDFGGVHINSGIPNRAFVIAALTIGGPAWEDAGRIESGMRADLVTVGLSGPRLAGTARGHALESLVYAAAPDDITTVISGGREIVSGGAHLAIDAGVELEAAIAAIERD